MVLSLFNVENGEEVGGEGGGREVGSVCLCVLPSLNKAFPFNTTAIIICQMSPNEFTLNTSSQNKMKGPSY